MKHKKCMKYDTDSESLVLLSPKKVLKYHKVMEKVSVCLTVRSEVKLITENVVMQRSIKVRAGNGTH